MINVPKTVAELHAFLEQEGMQGDIVKFQLEADTIGPCFGQPEKIDLKLTIQLSPKEE